MRWWSPEETAILRKRLLDGWSDERIGIELERSPRSVLSRRQRLGIPKGRSRPLLCVRWRRAEQRLADLMLAEGFDPGEIATVLGRTTGAVYKRIGLSE